MEAKKDEQMIYFKDLVFNALHHWKQILIIALIFALGLGGLQGISGLSALNSSSSVDSDSYAASLSEYEAEKESLEQQIDILQKEIESQQTYLESSVLMQLNPYGFYEATLTAYVCVDTQYQAVLLSGYKSALTGDTATALLADAVDNETQYISELLSVSVANDTGMLTVSIKYPTVEGAELLLSVAAAQLDEISEKLTQAVASHQVIIITRSVQYRIDTSLSATQKAATERTTTLLTSLNTAQDALDALREPIPQISTVSSVIKDVIIYCVLGFVLGAVLGVLVYFLAHICSGKIYSSRTLNNRTGIKVLGCQYSGKNTGFARWLCKKEGRNVSEPHAQAALLAVNVRNRCENTTRLLLTGSADAQSRELLAQALRNAMPGVQVDSFGSLLQDTNALESLAACDTVLLIAQCHRSRYDAAEQEAAIVCDCGKTLLGCVLLDG